MDDWLYIGVIVVAFGLLWAFVQGCAALRRLSALGASSGQAYTFFIVPRPIFIFSLCPAWYDGRINQLGRGGSSFLVVTPILLVLTPPVAVETLVMTVQEYVLTPTTTFGV